MDTKRGLTGRPDRTFDIETGEVKTVRWCGFQEERQSVWKGMVPDGTRYLEATERRAEGARP